MNNINNNNIENLEIENSKNNSTLNSSNILPKLHFLAEQMVKKFFEDKYFEIGNKQEWINQLCNDIVTEINNQYNGFKLVCSGYIVQKGLAPFFLDSNCLWDQKTDGVVTIKYENNYLYCIILLFIVSSS